MRLQIKNPEDELIDAYVEVEPIGVIGVLALQQSAAPCASPPWFVTHIPTTVWLTRRLPFRADALDLVLKIESWATWDLEKAKFLETDSRRRFTQHHLFDELRALCGRGS